MRVCSQLVVLSHTSIVQREREVRKEEAITTILHFATQLAFTFTVFCLKVFCQCLSMLVGRYMKTHTLDENTHITYLHLLHTNPTPGQYIPYIS